jgi:hypothetical protein
VAESISTRALSSAARSRGPRGYGLIAFETRRPTHTIFENVRYPGGLRTTCPTAYGTIILTRALDPVDSLRGLLTFPILVRARPVASSLDELGVCFEAVESCRPRHDRTLFCRVRPAWLCRGVLAIPRILLFALKARFALCKRVMEVYQTTLGWSG